MKSEKTGVRTRQEVDGGRRGFAMEKKFTLRVASHFNLQKTGPSNRRLEAGVNWIVVVAAPGWAAFAKGLSSHFSPLEIKPGGFPTETRGDF